MIGPTRVSAVGTVQSNMMIDRAEASVGKEPQAHRLFEMRANAMPSAPAVVFRGEVLTYAEINSLANRLARRLIARGAGPEIPVAVCLQRGPLLIATLLAVLKASAAYIPLDPRYPRDRLEYIAKNAAAPIIVAERPFLFGTAPRGQIVLASDLKNEAEREPADNLGGEPAFEGACYIMYTSGSTGRPKGVVVAHRALSSLLSAMTAILDVGSSDRWLALTTISFDIATLEWLLPLTVGAQVILASQEQASEGRSVRDLATERGATVLQATPSMWRMILASGELPETIRLAMCGGEAMPAALANRLNGSEKLRVWNVYGPTETTIWSAAHPLVGVEYRHNPPIGRPLSNTRLYVLDDDLKPVPKGGEGDLYIGGTGLARGYMASPDLTAERFIPDPFGPASGGRLYRTGDCVRLNSTDELEFLGRRDHQVKVRGHRIELGEIEAEIRNLAGVTDVAVITRADDSGDSSLVAFFVTERDTAVWASHLRSLLQTRLPEYMVPSMFVELFELPMTPNGKTDRRALVAMAQPAKGAQAIYVAPKTPAEKMLAGIWTDVLKVDRVGRDDDFFELGGHSLQAVEMLFRIEDAGQARVTFPQLLENSRLSALADLIDRLAPKEQGWNGELEP